MKTEIFAFACGLLWPDLASMFRDFFKRLGLGKRRPPTGFAPDGENPDLSRKLTTLLIPAPPGAADHVLWSLLLKGPPGWHGHGPKRRRRGRG